MVRSDQGGQADERAAQPMCRAGAPESSFPGQGLEVARLARLVEMTIGAEERLVGRREWHRHLEAALVRAAPQEDRERGHALAAGVRGAQHLERGPFLRAGADAYARPPRRLRPQRPRRPRD